MKTLPPKPLRAADIDKVEPNLRSLFLEILENPRQAMTTVPLVYLYGPEGCGKSYALSSLAMAIAAKRWIVSWLDCAEVPEPTDKASREELAALCTDIEERGAFLFIDDLGKESVTAREPLIKAIRVRINLGKMVLIASNHATLADDIDACPLTQFYGRSNRSRLLSGVVAFMDGADRRIPTIPED